VSGRVYFRKDRFISKNDRTFSVMIVDFVRTVDTENFRNLIISKRMVTL